MDLETWKFVLPFGGGVLALVGGFLTFLNGRLKDAEGDEGRTRVWTTTLNIGVLVAFLGAFAVTTIRPIGFLIAAALFLAGYACWCVLFVLNPQPAQRRDIVVFASFSVMTAISVSNALLFYASDRLIDLIDHLTK